MLPNESTPSSLTSSSSTCSTLPSSVQMEQSRKSGAGVDEIKVKLQEEPEPQQIKQHFSQLLNQPTNGNDFEGENVDYEIKVEPQEEEPQLVDEMPLLLVNSNSNEITTNTKTIRVESLPYNNSTNSMSHQKSMVFLCPPCPNCGIIFSSQSQSTQHIARCCQKTVPAQKVMTSITPVTPISTRSKKDYQTPNPNRMCSYCEKEFPSQLKMKMHEKVHINKKKKNKKKKIHNKPHNLHQCTLCAFQGKSLYDLKTHFRTHTKEKLWKCSESQCQSLSFSRKHSLECHKFSKHGINERNYKEFHCELCPFQTLKEAQLKIHFNCVHMRLKRFKCPRPPCPYQCSTKKKLTSHVQQLHSKGRPLQCTESGCRYAFKGKEYFIKHLETFHLKSREEIKNIVQDGQSSQKPLAKKPLAKKSIKTKLKSKVYSEKNIHEQQLQQQKPKAVVKSCTILYLCDSCDFNTKDEKHLAIHLNSEHNLPRVALKKLRRLAKPEARRKRNSSGHSKQSNNSTRTKRELKIYNCSESSCSYKTPHQYRLKYHFNSVHQRLNNFSCHLCSYTTARKDCVKRHVERVHFQNRPFKCPAIGCEYAAKTKYELNCHLQKNPHTKQQTDTQTTRIIVQLPPPFSFSFNDPVVDTLNQQN